MVEKIEKESELVHKRIDRLKDATKELSELESKMANLKRLRREKEQNYNEEISKITNQTKDELNKILVLKGKIERFKNATDEAASNILRYVYI